MGSDDEISMISLIYYNIKIKQYQIIQNKSLNDILGYRIIKSYRNVEGIENSILIQI